MGVGAVSVRVAVHCVVAPNGIVLGLQPTKTDTESPVAAWPDGNERMTASRVAVVISAR